MASSDFEAYLRRLDSGRSMREDFVPLVYMLLAACSFIGGIVTYVHATGIWLFLIGLFVGLALLFSLLTHSSYMKAVAKAKWYFEGDGKIVSTEGLREQERRVERPWRVTE